MNVDDVDEEIDRALHHLRTIMKTKGFSQVAVQEINGWKGSYISQILNRTKALRLEQLLRILATIDYPPDEFFSDLYGRPRRKVDPQELFEEAKQHLKAMMDLLLQSVEIQFID